MGKNTEKVLTWFMVVMVAVCGYFVAANAQQDEKIDKAVTVEMMDKSINDIQAAIEKNEYANIAAHDKLVYIQEKSNKEQIAQGKDIREIKTLLEAMSK
jgi:hypothetical protein